MKAQHDQNLDIFGDFFPQSSKKYFFIRTEVNQTVCLYKVDPCGKVLYLVPRSVQYSSGGFSETHPSRWGIKLSGED